MKHIFLIILVVFFSAYNIFAQNNRAIRLENSDNHIKIGMDTLKNNWTLEAWIKGDGDNWRELECIISGGEYGKQNISDHLPLVIKNGYLTSVGAKINSPKKLEVDKWIHVAASCDNKTTSLYIDGKCVASCDTVLSVLPGAIGVDEGDSTAFSGWIDEVRIWKRGLSEKEISQWKNKPIEPSHSSFKYLVGYYNFQDWDNNMSVNWVGRGHQAYHLRNGRLAPYSGSKLAYAQVEGTHYMNNYLSRQKVFSAININSEWDVEKGSLNEQMVKLRLVTIGTHKPLILKKLRLDLSRCSDLNDIKKVHVYYAGNSPCSKKRIEIGNGFDPKKELIVKLSKEERLELNEGVNYILVCFDIAKDAKEGNVVRADVSSYMLDNKWLKSELDKYTLAKEITPSSKYDDDILKVIQWNIWHGGLHQGTDGRACIIKLLKSSKADIVLMQEAYGGQQRFQDSLAYFMQSASNKDNLAAFSRYPFKQIKTRRPFYSNPMLVSMPNGRNVLINGCWLRYAYRPEYTCIYGEQGMDPTVWVKEDSLLGLQDAKAILKEDIYPYVDKETPIIMGGDFNSCSHLDWTPEASHLHYGYIAEELPISKYMYSEGFKDSFRELHPDEVKRGEGTYAVIFGHRQNSRIDFIYYKGSGIQALHSKIIRTSPEIDDVWASDHGAVITIFKISK